MKDSELNIRHIEPSLYNEDLAPIPHSKRTWGWFEIFNVWSNDIQSLFGYTLAASLFLTYGLNGWVVMAAIILAGFIVMALVNLSGRPSVKYGIPFPVLSRASMGVRGGSGGYFLSPAHAWKAGAVRTSEKSLTLTLTRPTPMSGARKSQVSAAKMSLRSGDSFGSSKIDNDASIDLRCRSMNPLALVPSPATNNPISLP